MSTPEAQRQKSAEEAINNFCIHDLRSSLEHLRGQVMELAEEIALQSKESEVNVYGVRDLLFDILKNS